MKPKYLYHGSPDGNISIIKPTQSPLILSKPVVFAGDLWVAISFCAKWSGNEIKHGLVKNKPYIQENQKNAFKRIFSKGGWVYTLPPNAFIPLHNTGNYEYVSYSAIIPLRKRFIKDPIRILNKLGVKIIPYSNVNVLMW